MKFFRWAPKIINRSSEGPPGYRLKIAGDWWKDRDQPYNLGSQSDYIIIIYPFMLMDITHQIDQKLVDIFALLAIWKAPCLGVRSAETTTGFLVPFCMRFRSDTAWLSLIPLYREWQSNSLMFKSPNCKMFNPKIQWFMVICHYTWVSWNSETNLPSSHQMTSFKKGTILEREGRRG